MAPRPRQNRLPTNCPHSQLWLETSPEAASFGYEQPNGPQRHNAARRRLPNGKFCEPSTAREKFTDPATFPAPLVLPDDDLACDPRWPPQLVRQWHMDEERNIITPERKCIYIVPPPQIVSEMSAMSAWKAPIIGGKPQDNEPDLFPAMDDMRKYLAAFYHGMDVKIWGGRFQWRAWEHRQEPQRKRQRNGKTTVPQTVPKYDGTPIKKNDSSQLVGLKTPKDEVFGIRCRASPDGIAAMQVNLDDVLDALSSCVPADAHSIMMLLREDMYESDDEIFTGGRAYGGSRIAVVSAFRDHHSLAPPDSNHSWPNSHCASYVRRVCGVQGGNTDDISDAVTTQGPLHAAVSAARADPQAPRTAEHLKTRWLACTVQTMAHELGHCFGLDHCIYLACVMQGAGSSAEAYRQPPYLCPVCLQKVITGIGEKLVKGWDEADGKAVRDKFVQERYVALKAVCDEWADPLGSSMFTGFTAWLGEMLK